MSWKEFELFAVDVLSRVYKQTGINIKHTPFQNDGGRDGVAYFFIEPEVAHSSLTEELAYEFKLWVEVKLRRNDDVNINDAGGHVVRAINRCVSKLIFVTNGSFADSLIREMAIFSHNNRLPCAFIDGEKLLQLHHEAHNENICAVDIKPQTKPLLVRIRFSRSAAATHKFGVETVYLDPDEPLFILTEVDYCLQINSSPTISIQSSTNYGEPHLLWSSYSPFMLTGQRFMMTHMIVPKEGSFLRSDQICVNFDFKINPGVIFDRRGALEVRKRFLAVETIESQKKAMNGLINIVDSWRQNGGISAVGIRGKGGVGKTHLLNKLRKRWLKDDCFEIMIDGEVHREPKGIANAILDRAFPLPPLPITDLKNACVDILREAGLGSEAIPKTVDAILHAKCGVGQFSLDIPELCILIATCLRAISGRRSVLVIEDVHKLSPSSLQLLIQLRRILKSHSRGTVLLAFVGRPELTSARQELNPISTLFKELKGGLIDVDDLSSADAQKLLSKTIPGLDGKYAQHVIDQVGTSPFALKEVIALLEWQGIISRVEDEEVRFTFPDKKVFSLRLRTTELNKASYQRIKMVIEQFCNDEDWLEDFLASGAILGRSFVCQDALAAAERSSLPKQIKKALFHWDILELRSHDGVKHAEFTHDLIRSAVLKLAKRENLVEELASVLLDQNTEESFLTKSRLAFLAGRHAKCTEYAEQACLSMRDGHRYWDAFQASLIKINAIDPDVFAAVIGDSRISSIAHIDETLSIVETDKPISVRPYSTERNKKLNEALFECMEILIQIRLGKRLAFPPLLTEAMMLSKELGDKASQAKIKYIEGRTHFDEDSFDIAKFHHSSAEEIFETIWPQESAARKDNLNRLFLCERQIGELDSARETLKKIKKLSKDNFKPEDHARYVAYRGYSYLYTDPLRTLKDWREASDIALDAGISMRAVVHLTGAGYMELLVGSYQQAELDFELAEQLLGTADVVSSRIRLLMNRGLLRLVQSRMNESRSYLETAAILAVEYGITRRGWRVEANLATVHEALGNLQLCESFNARTWEGVGHRIHAETGMGAEASWLSQRHVLPVLNILLQRESPLCNHIENAVPPEQFNKLKEMTHAIITGETHLLPHAVKIHLREINRLPRLLVTE